MPKINVSNETINELKSLVGNSPKTGEQLSIAIVDSSGLTYVGYMNLDGDNEWITITNARCIIYWGTTKHLAELAVNGPNSKTRLGAKCTVTVRRDKIIAVYVGLGGCWDE